ncbi:hypothetical protein ACTMTJ_09100 [Phytohabitans sp. LJ34]|uniref:hypothetical protein n=1 Tax=Phytohabitans sp. LJ34 TaxID=3452217 RepID=UPI003F8ABAC6
MTDPAAPLDEVDLSILDHIAAVHGKLDPPPADLDARVRFALSRPDPDVSESVWEFEVARLVEEVPVGSGARASERTRTITFEADSRTVMITIVGRLDGSVRLEGWLAPAAPLRVELRLPEPAPAQTAQADEVGRFVFDEVARGLAQLLVHPPDDTVPRVVTPSLAL